MCQAVRTTYACGHTQIRSGVCYAFPHCSNVQGPRSTSPTPSTSSTATTTSSSSSPSSSPSSTTTTSSSSSASSTYSSAWEADVDEQTCPDCQTRASDRRRLWEWHRSRLGMDREAYLREKRRIRMMMMMTRTMMMTMRMADRNGGGGNNNTMLDPSGTKGSMWSQQLQQHHQQQWQEHREDMRRTCFDFEDLSVHLPGLFEGDGGQDGDMGRGGGGRDSTWVYRKDDTEGRRRMPGVVRAREVTNGGKEDGWNWDGRRGIDRTGAGSVVRNGELVYEFDMLGDGTAEVVEESGQRARLARREQREQRGTGEVEFRKREERRVWFGLA